MREARTLIQVALAGVFVISVQIAISDAPNQGETRYRSRTTTGPILSKARLRFVSEKETSDASHREERLHAFPASTDKAVRDAFRTAKDKTRPIEATVSWDTVQTSSSPGIRLLLTLRNTTSDTLNCRVEKVTAEVYDAEDNKLDSPFFGGSGQIDYAHDSPNAAIEARIRQERLEQCFDIEKIYVLGSEVSVTRNPRQIDQELRPGEDLGVELWIRRLAADYNLALKNRDIHLLTQKRSVSPGLYNIAVLFYAGDASKPATVSKYVQTAMVRVE